jgi:signal transduction histidine kinase
MTSSLRAQRDHLVAQEKLATVGRLAAGVAHEVGNPLAAILGYVELLLAAERPPGAAEDQDRREALERIRKETVRISGIVSDLLDYSRPQAGRVEPVDIGGAIDAALSLLAPQARFRGVEVARLLPAGLPRVAASSSRVVQVLVNLLLNAADAMGGTGSVTITAAANGASVAIRVSDVGPGVPAADCARLFDPFFTTKAPGEGTGLGLAISRSIAQAYGGDLSFNAAAAPGATFMLTLPTWSEATSEHVS